MKPLDAMRRTHDVIPSESCLDEEERSVDHNDADALEEDTPFLDNSNNAVGLTLDKELDPKAEMSDVTNKTTRPMIGLALFSLMLACLSLLSEEKYRHATEEEHLLYGPFIYPWARDVGSFLCRIQEGQKVVQEARQSLWNKHQPHSEDVYSYTVDMVNDGPLLARFAKSILEQSSFTIGVMGTSVTAGHDNYFNESYPIVWGDRMQEAFAASGVELIVRNNAMGWNPIYPSYYCVEEILGKDVDISVWEFSMMTPAMPDWDTEHWMRNAFALPNQPHLLFLDPGGGERYGATEPRTEPKPIRPWIVNPMQWYTDAGFSIATSQLEKSFWTLDHLPAYSFHHLMEEDKASEHLQPHHPGPHGHELRGDVLAYNYLGYFASALDLVYNAVNNQSSNFTSILPAPLVLPEPKACAKDLCEHPPKCVTTFEPRFGPSLMDYVIYPDPEQIPFVNDSRVAASNSQKGWHQQLYWCDNNSVDYMLQKGLNYLDRKYLIQGNIDDGPLRLQFESETENYVILCAAPGNSHLCYSSIWKIDDEVIACYDESTAKAKDIPFTYEPCYITEKKIPKGVHTFEITMVQPSPERDHDNFIPLSNLVWW